MLLPLCFLSYFCLMMAFALQAVLISSRFTYLPNMKVEKEIGGDFFTMSALLRLNLDKV